MSGRHRFLSRSHWRSVATDLLWRRLSPSWTLPTDLRIDITCEAEWIIYNDIFVDREYETAFAAMESFLKSHNGNALVLDLGANVGFFTAATIDYMRRRELDAMALEIYAFEASSHLAERFRERTLPIAKPPVIHLKQGLVGRREGSAGFSEGDFHIGNRVHGTENQVVYIDVEKSIPADLPIALLKCDIEGSEEEFLETYPALLQRSHAVLMELHDERCNTDRCRQLVQEAGFAPSTMIKRMKTMSVELFTRS
ncbi:MAG: FkbM family methyltransferase [Candidatus Sumerlaeia bacterium]|nr:FkbM family methyltransferase [Candidatus Sumerlaeia bacterium]